MSPFPERRALSFTFLDLELVELWSLSMGVRAALQAGPECLREEHPRGGSWGAFWQSRETNTFPREEGVTTEWLILVPVPVFCIGTDLLPTSANATCCIYLIPPVQHLGAPPGRAGFAAEPGAGLGQINISQTESIPLSLGAGQLLQQDDPLFPPAGVQLNCWELWEGFKSLLSQAWALCRKDQRTCLSCASAAGLILCFWGCSHPSFSALAGLQVVVCFLHLPTVSLLCSAPGPGTIPYFSLVS